MPTITIRISATERARLDREAASRGVKVSDVVRGALFPPATESPDDGYLESRIDDHESRLTELERIAGV